MAKEFAEKYLGKEDDITINLSGIYEKAKAEISNQINKAKEKEAKMEIVRAKNRAISANKKGSYMQSHTYSKNNGASPGGARSRRAGGSLVGIPSLPGQIPGQALSSQELHEQAQIMASSPGK